MAIRGLQSDLFWAFRGKPRSKGLVLRENARRTELANIRLQAGVRVTPLEREGHKTGRLTRLIMRIFGYDVRYREQDSPDLRTHPLARTIVPSNDVASRQCVD